VDVSASVVVWHGDVQVFDPRMYMECELLTVLLQTNRPVSAESASLTNISGRVDTIIAETNVLMMARGTTIIGDRAVYTATNEVVVVTGMLVIIENEKSFIYGTNFVFNRITGDGYAVGPTVVELKLEPGLTGTNATRPNWGGELKPRAPAIKPKGIDGK